jgi:MFS family permease
VSTSREWRRRLGHRFQVLSQRNVRRFFLGYVTSNFGTAMASVALAFAVLDNGGSASDLGLVFAAGIVPQVVLMLLGGVVADRMGRGRVMLASDVFRCCCQGLLAVALFAGGPPIWLFAALAAGVGVGDAFFQPALTALTVEIAPSHQMGDANALFGMARSGSSVAGPAVAGIVVAVASPAAVIALDAASYAISAVALGLLRSPPAVTGPARSLVRDLAEGWVEFRSRTWLWATTVQFALFNLITWGPFLVLGPVLADEGLGGAGAWGAIMAAYGAGAVVGGLAALGRKPRRPLVVATLASLGYPLPLALLAVQAPAAGVAAGAFLAGVGSATFNVFLYVSLQQQVPPAAQARVDAFTLVGAYGFGPLAFAAAGPIAGLVGAHTVLGFGAAWAVLGSLVVLALPSVRAVRWRADPMGEQGDSDTAPASAGRSIMATGRRRAQAASAVPTVGGCRTGRSAPSAG